MARWRQAIQQAGLEAAETADKAELVMAKVYEILDRFDRNGVTIAGVPVRIPRDDEAKTSADKPFAIILASAIGFLTRGKGKPEAGE